MNRRVRFDRRGVRRSDMGRVPVSSSLLDIFLDWMIIYGRDALIHLMVVQQTMGDSTPEGMPSKPTSLWSKEQS